MREHDFIAPDLGNPFQHADTPRPIKYELTPHEQDKAALYSLDLERQRREANRRDALRHSRRPRHDNGPEAA